MTRDGATVHVAPSVDEWRHYNTHVIYGNVNRWHGLLSNNEKKARKRTKSEEVQKILPLINYKFYNVFKIIYYHVDSI